MLDFLKHTVYQQHAWWTFLFFLGKITKRFNNVNVHNDSPLHIYSWKKLKIATIKGGKKHMNETRRKLKRHSKCSMPLCVQFTMRRKSLLLNSWKVSVNWKSGWSIKVFCFQFFFYVAHSGKVSLAFANAIRCQRFNLFCYKIQST